MGLKDLLEPALKMGKGLQANPLAARHVPGLYMNGAAAAMKGGKAGAWGLGLLAKTLGWLAAAGAAVWKARQSGLLAGMAGKAPTGKTGAPARPPDQQATGAKGTMLLQGPGKTAGQIGDKAASKAADKGSGITGKLIGAAGKTVLDAAHKPAAAVGLACAPHPATS